MKKALKITGGCVVFGLLVFLGFMFIKDHFLDKPVQQDTVANLVIDTSAESKSEAAEALKDRRVFFAGINDGAVAQNAAIALTNPKDNEDIVLKYTIIDEDTGKTIHETDLIESDKAVEWVPSKDLKAGTYHLAFQEQPYYQVDGGDWLPLTAGSNSVELEVLAE